jgi:hypothetical protein
VQELDVGTRSHELVMMNGMKLHHVVVSEQRTWLLLVAVGPRMDGCTSDGARAPGATFQHLVNYSLFARQTIQQRCGCPVGPIVFALNSRSTQCSRSRACFLRERVQQVM